MAQGYAFNGSAPVQLTDQNTYRWNGTGWELAPTLHAQVAGTYQDVLYHAPSYPPIGMKWYLGVSGKVYYSTVSQTAVGVKVSTFVKNSGYDVAATKTSGLRFKVTFKRGSINPGYWFTIQALTSTKTYGVMYGVNANTEYSYVVPAANIEATVYQTWIDAPQGGGGQGREIDVSGVSIEVIK